MPCGRASDQIEIFCAYIPEIPIHSLLSSLYYAETPKVPPRVFGPLGPKTLRGQICYMLCIFDKLNTCLSRGPMYDVQVFMFS